ncbi:MAG: SGNH/GDSL hydrolase family protein [Gemmataceae bacterium]|nr:SGNH/GDSL hydrolase family protein [Gemmataceae bacterium]
MMRPLVGLFLLWLIPFVAHAQEPFVLKDGDRVVFLGNGVIEQEHAFGHLETRLTRRWPQANVTFRNMGWGGDTVQGLARTGGFRQPDGMDRLLNEIKQAKPTVIFVGYGLNESFAGEKGLASFIRDYRKLLEQIDPVKARLILLSPTWHEDLGRPLPDPSQHNKDLEKYAEAIYQIASERKAPYVDLLQPLREAKGRTKAVLTTNGIQLNDRGYAAMASAIEHGLGVDPTPWELEFGPQGASPTGFAIKQTMPIDGGWKITFEDEIVRAPGEVLRMKWNNAKDGAYYIEFDGKTAITVPASKLANGMPLEGPIALAEGEKLRQAIVKKGELFYRRWRPFNDHSRHWSFIGGDFKLYDDEIAALEKTIAELRVPRERTIEIKPAKGGER